MHSRERYLAALRHQRVDHVPLLLRLWSMGGEDRIPFRWRDQVTRAESLLALSIDDTLLLQPPLGQPEEYRVDECAEIAAEVSRVPTGDAEAPELLRKTYWTDDGPLVMTVRRSADWPHGDDVPLFDDYNVARYVEAPIKDVADVRRLRHLLADPTPAQLEEFKARSLALHRDAERLGVAVEGGFIALGDSVLWLCGMENVLYWQMDEPQLLEALLDTLLEWELNRERRLLDEGVDAITYSAWYEGVDFYTPANYRRLIKPRLKALVDLAHAHGAGFRYIITKGWFPLRENLLEIGVDCIAGVDPVQDAISLKGVKAAVGDHICLMGGINSAIMLAQWGDDAIRAAVDEAMSILAPGGGFILYPVDCTPCELPWDRTELIIEQWRRHWAS